MLSDNQIYYFEIGRGRWQGRFSFRITNDRAFKKSTLTFKQRFLVRGMQATHALTGDSRIDSDVWARPEEGVAGIAGNTVRISRFGITLYLLNETYTLDENGTDVAVHAHERFGPIPFLFKVEKRHPAVIHADGMSSSYYIPLLGADFTANYTVHDDRKHIDGLLTCPWAEGQRDHPQDLRAPRTGSPSTVDTRGAPTGMRRTTVRADCGDRECPRPENEPVHAV